MKNSPPTHPARVECPANLGELRDDLLEVYAAVRNREVDPADAKEMANVAGKVIKSLCVELDYAKLRKETPTIPFIAGKNGRG